MADSNLDKQLVHSTVAASLFGGDAVRKVRLGRFHLVRMLGSGAMGTVFEAHDPDNDDRLAIKVLNELGSSAIYRIKREFRSLAGVVHPNLVVLHELCQEDHRWFFTMELVQGVPFDRWVRPGRSRGLRFDEGRLRVALAGLAAGVQAIHEAGKLHRDLKPGNVLVTSDGTVKVLDFGLMSDKGPTAWRQADSGLMGTPAYMAPESPAFEDATEASDWYAVGVMLFDALMGGARNEAWAEDVLGALARRADQMDTPYARALTHFARSASLLFTARRFRDASHPALRAKEVFAQHCPGAFWERNVVDFFHLVCLEFTGSLSEQLERSMEALRDAKERDDLFLARLMLLSVPYAYLILDQPDAALDFLRRAEESLEPTYATDRTLWLLRMIDVLIYSGRAADGLTLLMAEWPLLARSHIFRSQYIRHDANYFRARCALAAHAEARDPRAMTVAHDALRSLRAESGVFGAICQALTAGLMAEGRAAVELEHACVRLDGAQAPLIASYARRRLCELKRDREGAAAIDLELQHQGVANAARWLWTHMPIGWNL